MKTYCFDIDDTILFSDIQDNGEYKLKGSDIYLITIINKLYDEGNQIVIQTGRHWNHLSVTKKQLAENNIKYHTLIMGNVVADYYINDKGMSPERFKHEYRRSLQPGC